MRAFIIKDSDINSVLESSTIDKYYVDLFRQMVTNNGMLLSEYIYGCFCGYLTGYIRLNDLNLDLAEHNKIYDRFISVVKSSDEHDYGTLIEHNNFYAQAPLPSRHTSTIDFDVMQVNIVESMLASSESYLSGKYRSELYDDVYDLLVGHHTGLEGSRQIPLMENLIREEMEVIVTLVKFTIDQIESRILNQRSECPTCYMLFGMNQGSAFVLIH